MWIAKAEHGRKIDRRASEEFGIPAQKLMSKAGEAVFEAISEFASPGDRIAVFCGKGNNGGDGFVVARLAQEQGYAVECLVAACENEIHGLPAQELASARAAGVCIVFCDCEKWGKKLECV